MFVVINLGDYQTTDSRVFYGRTEGEQLRKKLDINTIDKLIERGAIEKIIVKIPKDTLSLNTSFFLGLFRESVRIFGETGFKEKYQFDCEQLIRRSINYDIDEALK